MCNESVVNLHSLFNIVLMIQSVEHVACMGKIRHPFKCWLETLSRRDSKYILLWCIDSLLGKDLEINNEYSMCSR
jgi:hypothetical protein